VTKTRKAFKRRWRFSARPIVGNRKDIGATVKSRTQVDFPHKPSPLPDDLRRWIDLVIVPILVEQYLREEGAPGERTDG
jgi:hypothetical protein